MNSAGGLKELNRSYKLYRQKMISEGLGAVSYGHYLGGFIRSIIRLTAASASGIDGGHALLSGPAVNARPNDPTIMFSPLLLAQFVEFKSK